MSDNPLEPVIGAAELAVATPVVATPVAFYFDGASSRKREVSLAFSDQCDIVENGEAIARWPFSDIRRADSVEGVLRASCLSALPLARLNIRDKALAAELLARCPQFDANVVGSSGLAKIIGWSLAAVVSIVGLVLYGLPLLAERLTPLVPASVEARLGDAVDKQVKLFLGDKTCENAEGRAAFLKLVDTLRQANGMNTSVDAVVLASPIPNAFALPGGKVYLLNGLLQKTENSDELAGVLAHEMGHVIHRDGMRNMIYTGSTSYLVGLLFGDVTGAGALIFVTRNVLNTSYTRQAETNADTVAIETMLKLGRSPKPLGDLLFRITGKEGDKSLSIMSSHPLTEDRQARFNSFDRSPTSPSNDGRQERFNNSDQSVAAPPILTDSEWASLKAICK